MDYKFKIPIFEIDDDGDLKFVEYFVTNHIPNIDDTIVILMQDNDTGRYTRRVYFNVKERLFCSTMSDGTVIEQFGQEPISLHVIKLIDEEINNWKQ